MMRNAGTAAARVSGISPILLANCSQLADIDTHSLLELSRRSESRLVLEGEEIFRQGEEATSVFMLLDGAIDLERMNEDRTRSGYEVVAPQATFGDVVLLVSPRDATPRGPSPTRWSWRSRSGRSSRCWHRTRRRPLPGAEPCSPGCTARSPRRPPASAGSCSTSWRRPSRPPEAVPARPEALPRPGGHRCLHGSVRRCPPCPLSLLARARDC